MTAFDALRGELVVAQKRRGYEMTIGVAVQRGSLVHVYDEKGRQLCTLSGGSKSGDGLKGYTGQTVSIQRSGLVYTYDEKGRQLSAISARR